MERMVAIEQKMGRLPSQQERIRRHNAGDIPPMPASPVTPEDEHHEEPVPGTPPPERDEDEAMEDNAPQDPASEEDDDEGMPSYRRDAFGAGADSDDSDHEEITAPGGQEAAHCLPDCERLE